MGNELISVTNLTKVFKLKSLKLHAVNGVSFDISQGQTLGLVGQSGCGKSTLARMIVGLCQPTSGDIKFLGNSVVGRRGGRRSGGLSRCINYLMPDPSGALNPKMSVLDIVSEPIMIHHKLTKFELRDRVANILESVQLGVDYIDSLPHELSGGQKQLVCVARAIALDPLFLILDEPIASLDSVKQASVMALFKKLQNIDGITYMFISHDIAATSNIASSVAIMYLGSFVECIASKSIHEALHPYTKRLLDAIPCAGKMITVDGEDGPFEDPTGSIFLPKGCVYCKQCPHAMPKCFINRPKMKSLGNNHKIACHLHDV